MSSKIILTIFAIQALGTTVEVSLPMELSVTTEPTQCVAPKSDFPGPLTHSTSIKQPTTLTIIVPAISRRPPKSRPLNSLIRVKPLSAKQVEFKVPAPSRLLLLELAQAVAPLQARVLLAQSPYLDSSSACCSSLSTLQ